MLKVGGTLAKKETHFKKLIKYTVKGCSKNPIKRNINGIINTV